MNVITQTYDSTNYYLVQASSGWLMIDNGWAGTLPKLLALLKQRGISPKEIKHLVVTHFHPDHAGLVEDLKDYGAKLVVHDCQVPFMGQMKPYFKPNQNFREIQAHGNIIVTSAESRPLLQSIGIAGEVLPTPGHSDDSVSVILDEGAAFTGDLPPASAVDPESNPKVKDSWVLLQNHGVQRVYPGHGNSFPFMR